MSSGIETKRPVDWVTMPDGEDWLYRPVREGMCRYESMKDCTLDLYDIDKMNQILDVKEENEKRYHKAQES